MIQAFGIFSGGLDSLLAARLLMDQGLVPTLITFACPFFPDIERAAASARALGLPLTASDLYDDLLPLVKNPPHGHGRCLNPCIDCHALMFRRAGEMLEKSGGQGFLFSGEVLGQRPMSQNSEALKIVARDAGFSGRILRPLSAKILPPTEAEEKGWVYREKLLGLSGRSRRAQMALARGYGLPTPTPAGGCLLTDAGYSRRLRWLLAQPQNAAADWPPARLAETLKHGRVFSAEPGLWAAVGRNKTDNEALERLAAPGDLIFHLESAPGPTVLMPLAGFAPGPASLEMARGLAAAYGDNGGRAEAPVRMKGNGEEARLMNIPVRRPSDWSAFMIPKAA